MPGQTTLTNLSFPEFVRAHKFVLIHFWASWNRYDVTMRELVESQIQAGRWDEVAFAIFSTDPEAHWEVCREHKVLGLPFLEFYRDGSNSNRDWLAPAGSY